MKKLFLLAFITTTLLLSCSKKDEPSAIVCFDDTYNGTYNGTLTINQISSLATLKVTKKGCYEAQLESASNIGDKNINSIIPNGQNGFNGKFTEDGSGIIMTLSGNKINIVANTKYSFVGTK